jgi:hypothetical protein
LSIAWTLAGFRFFSNRPDRWLAAPQSDKWTRF